MFKKLMKNNFTLFGFAAVSFLFIIALLAPFIAPYDPIEINVKNIFLAPSLSHIFGTDELGRDVFSRILWGARVSLLVGVIAVSISTFIGIILGALSGYYKGWVDKIIMRFVDIMLAIPSFFLILAVIAFLGPSVVNIMIVIGCTSWMGVARLVRAEVLSLKEREFVLAAKSIGASNFRIIFRHILPNSLAPVFVYFVLGVAGAILVESSLSFLGIGVQPPAPSWGNILAQGKDNIEAAWWLSVFPGFAILITVLSYNLLGEGLRDILDPRLER